MEIRQTDAQGRITARDSHEIASNTVKCMAVERLSAEEMVSFNSDEINLIYQFREKSREGTFVSLREIELGIADNATRKIVGGTMQKLSGLSEENYGELITSTKNRKLVESDCSIRERLAKSEK